MHIFFTLMINEEYDDDYYYDGRYPIDNWGDSDDDGYCSDRNDDVPFTLLELLSEYTRTSFS